MALVRALGIDPGSRVTGFGVVEGDAQRLRHLAHGTLRPPADADLAARLAYLHGAIGEIVRQHQPQVAVVERVFVSVSPKSALVLGQARGVALAALATAGLGVNELSPSEVKQAVACSGRATKAQIQVMVRRLLELEEEPPSDAADALAAAIGQVQLGPLAGLGVRRRGRRRLRPRSALSVRRAP